MTYRDLLYKATRLCDKGEITIGQYEEMTKPLDREVEQEPFINKPCVSSGVCEHDKNAVLDKIRAEIEKDAFTDVNNSKFISVNRVNQIFDKYKAESEVKANENEK